MTRATMPNWLQQRAFLTPDRIALTSGPQTWTFRELDAQARQTAQQLAALNVRAGDHIALLVTNGLHTAALIHALHYLGAVLVPLNTRLVPRELSWQIKDAEASLLICDRVQQGRGEMVAEEVPGLNVITWRELTVREPKTERATFRSEIRLDDVQSIMYTSGTTGYPKGVQLTYGNHWWSAIGSALNLELHADDRWLVSVPLFHMSGLSILMRSVIYGMTAVIHETFDPHAVNRAIMEDKVTIVSVVSAMLQSMLEKLGRHRYPASFRCMLLGGGPAPKPLLEQCTRKHIPVFQTYGLTETASQIATLSSDDMLSKLGSAGKPLFPAQLRIEQDGYMLPAGHPGEIVVKGPNVTKGYWKREEATNRVLRNGWLYTGDIGYLDEEGFLFVLDRRQDLIVSGGENVYPAEIESVLLSHPFVADAGVTGTPDTRWGQVPIAFVVRKPRPSIDETVLLDFCRERLAKYKVPVKVRFVNTLPRNAAGKLQRHKLLDL